MFFVLLGSVVVDFSEFVKFRGALRTVQAEITGTDETNIEVNDEKVIHCFYRYEVDGQTFDGACYDQGEEYGLGDRVTVEFPPEYPELARIVGARRGAVPTSVLPLIGIFPTVGLIVTIPGLPSGRRALRLLRFGTLARGTLQSKEPTSMVINDQPVYKLTFTFLQKVILVSLAASHERTSPRFLRTKQKRGYSTCHRTRLCLLCSTVFPEAWRSQETANIFPRPLETQAV